MADHTSFTVGLVADDLTGASDAAVQFARRGWHTLLVLGSDPQTKIVRGSDASPSLVALSTDARALDNASAARATERAVGQVAVAGADRVFLKIDSTMRGSVQGQISGALRGWRVVESNAFAVVCPAYPRMGRTVVGNRVLVNGQPVELTAAGSDPVTPMRTGDLAQLLPESTHMKRHAEKGYGPFSRCPFSVTTCDATTDDDLAALARAIAGAGRAAIPVGSGGLASAMAACWSTSDERPADAGALKLRSNARVLIQVTSLNPVSLNQVVRLSAAFPDIVILAGKANEVSVTLEAHVRSKQFDLLGLIGGDGARAALARLEASAIRIVDSVLEGVPLGVIAGGHADGMPVFTKAGGFGAEDALVQIVEKLRQ